MAAQHTPRRPSELTVEDLRTSFGRHGQAHVFAHWDRLDDAGRQRLLGQLRRIEPWLDDLVRAYRAALPASAGQGPQNRRKIEPADAIPLPENGGDPRRAEAARERGEALLADGRVGIFLVAGGQGTRLGFPHPKGCFPVGPVTDRTLFEIQAQKIRGLARRTGGTLPWYIMTSDATDAETRQAFEDHGWFGLDPADVWIFQQDMVPAFDFEGRLILEAPDRIFESPNGHGGSLTALESSGALDDMAQRGIDILFYYQVDNPLVKMADPVYLGFHAETGAEMSCKVVRKVDPMEKVGVVARVDGHVGVVEYTELADEERYARDPDGGLRFWAGSIAIHLLDTGFVRRVADDAYRLLPFHLSAKAVPFVDADGRPHAPAEPNGYKLERFVFDALREASQVCVVETTATEEFAPIKNAEGPDSAETCRRALTAQYRRWLVQRRDPRPGRRRPAGDRPLADRRPGDVRSAGFKSLAEAGNAIRTAGRDR